MTLHDPMPTQGIPAICSLPYDAVRWEVLKTALELKIFGALAEPTSADTVAETLSLHRENTGHLLRALVGLGCLETEDGLFRNTAMADTFLVGGKRTSMGDALIHMDERNHSLLNGGLRNMVRNGPPPPPSMNPGAWAKSARAMRSEALCSRVPGIVAHLASIPEFAKVKRILDLGAGNGVIGVAVAQACPAASCVLFDRPAICAIAEETIADYGLADRVTTRSGDYAVDPIGEGYDMIMANYTLHFYRDDLDGVLKKVLAALNPGGILFVTSDGVSPDATAPARTIVDWLPVSMLGIDRLVRRGEIAQAMRRAGFVATMSDMPPELNSPVHGPTDITVGWKGK